MWPIIPNAVSDLISGIPHKANSLYQFCGLMKGFFSWSMENTGVTVTIVIGLLILNQVLGILKMISWVVGIVNLGVYVVHTLLIVLGRIICFLWGQMGNFFSKCLFVTGLTGTSRGGSGFANPAHEGRA